MTKQLTNEPELTIMNGILDGPEPISDGILDLCDGVVVGPLDDNRH